MKVVIIYVFEGAQSKYHIIFSNNKMADPIWRPLFHEISFSKIEAMRVVITYVFGVAQSKYHIRISKKKMANPIWWILFHGISFSYIEAMHIVIIYVFEGTQSKYHIKLSENKMADPILCFINMVYKIWTKRTPKRMKCVLACAKSLEK